MSHKITIFDIDIVLPLCYHYYVFFYEDEYIEEHFYLADNREVTKPQQYTNIMARLENLGVTLAEEG